MSPYTLPAGNVQISFSGGRTSGYMLHQIAEANGGIPERVKVVFANTGREMPQTLDFVQECSEQWSIPIVWVEYRSEGGKFEKFETVSHNSASRNGEPFEDLICNGVRDYLPNPASRHCTSDLKVRPIRDYLMSLGWTHWKSALGIRADEANRSAKPQKERWENWRPLVDAGVSKHDVALFWRGQAFDLQLENINGNSWLGNCDGCFLKSEANLSAFLREYPERHAWWERMEEHAAFRSKDPSGAQFREEYSRRELRLFIERQGDFAFETEGLLCQASGGECLA